MADQKSSQEFELVIPSNRKNIHRVEEFFRDVNKTICLSDEKLHALLVAVTEAVNNGIIHGNKNDETKQVTVNCSFQGHVMNVRVKDEGEGFKPEDIANPLQEDNLLLTGGRGVFLIKTFMQSVKYNEKGNEVTMTMCFGE